MNRLALVATILGVAVATEHNHASPAPSASPPAASTGGPKPFLSKVNKLIDPAPPSPAPVKFVSHYGPIPTPSPSPSPSATPFVRFRPAKEGAEEPFYDVPWAVHLPIEVPFEGGAARITWQATVSWENGPEEWRDHTTTLTVVGAGVYRLDGKRLSQNALRRDTSALKWEGDAPLPTYTFSYQTSLTGERDKHTPSVRDDYALVVDPALPGWYALWLAIDSGFIWPAKEPKRDFLQGSIHFDCIVSRGTEPPTSAEREYLFGRGKRPEKMQDDKFYKVSKLEVPFKLRRDSWEFDHIEVVRTPDDQGKMVDKKRAGYGDKYHKTYSIYAAKQKASGKDVELELTEKIQTNPRGELTDKEIPDNDSAFDTVYIWDEKWKASFPPSLADNSFGSVKFTGERKGHYQQKGQFGTSASGTYSNWDPGGPWLGVAPPYYQTRAWIEEIRHPWEKSAQSGEKQAKDELVQKYGKDAAEWFVPDYFEDYRSAGVKQGEAPAQYVIRANRPVVPDAAPLQVGAWPLVGFHVGPWEICGIYKRKSELENRVVASKAESGETTVVSDEDDFWKWYPELVAVIAREKMKADKAVTDAGLEGLPLQQLLKSQKRLLFSLSDSTGNVTSAVDPVNVSSGAAKAMRSRLSDITTEIETSRDHIAARTREARDAYKRILDKLEEGNDKFGGPGHAELYVWRQQYRKIYERIPFSIAIASHDPVVLKKTLADAESEAHGGNTRIVEAQLDLALGDSVAALYALRSAVAVTKNAGNQAKPSEDETMAAQMLRDVECSFLKNAIDKSQGAIAEARRAFYGYMMERGFPEYYQMRDTTVKSRDGNVLDMPLAHAIAATEYTLAKEGETAWAILTTGLFGSMSGIYGKPAAEADLLDTTEKRMTTAFIGLNTMLRLRGNGYTFDDIGKMTSTQIRDALPLRKINGDLYSDQEAALQRVAIREAMNLPDIQALVSGDRMGLQLGLQKKYWNAKDVGDTWIEWIGDATSMYNLILMLPGAQVGTAGRLGVFWGEADLKVLEALQKSGEVITGTEAIANTVGLTQFLGAAGATDTGKAVLQYLKAIGRYEEQLKWSDKLIWTSGKLTGMLTINFITVGATEKLFGHKAAMLMQAVLMFGSDPETLVKLLDSQNIPRQRVAELIINEYLPATEVHLKRLAQIEKSSWELEQLFARTKAGQRLSKDDVAFLDKYFKKDWRTLIPNGQASHDAEIALGAAAEGAGNGVDNGAGKAVAEKLKAARQAETEQVTKAAEEGKKLASKLEGAAPARGPPPPIEPPRPPRNLQRATFTFRRGAKGLGEYPKPPFPHPGSECAKAEALLHLGKYVEAQAAYESIIDRILKGELFIADEMPLEYIHLKRCLAHELQDAKRAQATLASKALNKPIPAQDVERILSDRNKWKTNSDQGAIGKVYTVEGETEYLVKTVKQTSDLNAVADVEANMAHTELARALGFDVPAMEVRFTYGPDGRVDEAIYVMRRIKGGRLSDLKAADIFLFKDELSRHRALAVLMGDFDRKIDNYMVMEGRLIPIDAGLGDITGQRLRDLGFAPDEAFTIDGQAGRDHWLSRFFKDEISGKDANGNPLGRSAPVIQLWEPSESFARKGLVAEEALTYQAAKPVVDEINEKLINNETRLKQLLEDAFMKTYGSEFEVERLTQRVVDARKGMGEIVDLTNAAVKESVHQQVLTAIKNKVNAKVEESVKFLRARAAKLDGCMKGLNERNAIPLSYLRFKFHAVDRELQRKIIITNVFDQEDWLAAA